MAKPDPHSASFPPDFADDTRPVKRPRNTNDSPIQDRQPPAHPNPLPSSSSDPIPHPNELRRRQGKRPTLSCAECRRLKLKCDRTFPCASCTKRGCAQICPDGSLQSGRGSRFILANTSQLHEKILQLSDRVKDLEGGLETLQFTVSPERKHPLLHPDLLKIRASNDLQSLSDANGVERMSYSSHPQPRLSPTGGQERHYSPDNSEFTYRQLEHVSAPSECPIPDDIMALSASFPVTWQVNISVRQRIRDLLPPQEESRRICENAQRHAFFQYNLDGSETFLSNLLYHVYNVSIQNLNPRRLALLLMMLAIGSAVDLTKPMPSPIGDVYYHLARACISEIPVISEPNFDQLRAMFLMMWYMLAFSNDQKDVGYAWNTMGITVRLAQSIGLHRDASRMKNLPEEAEQKKVFWWELVHLDCRMSLSLGRPPAISLQHSDCQKPSYGETSIYGSREKAIYHEWKHEFYVTCLNPILMAVAEVKPPDYSEVLHLDGQVRDFPLPSALSRENVNAPLFLDMQRILSCTSREIALLQLHRSSFNKALSGPQSFTMEHPLAPSVLATFCSACAMISATEEVFNMNPPLSVRFLGYWFNAFSAGVALSLLVSRAPSSFLAPAALKELERLRDLWRRVIVELPCCGKVLGAIENSADKSRRIYLQWRTESGGVGHASRELPLTFRRAHAYLKNRYNYGNSIPHPPINDIPVFASDGHSPRCQSSCDSSKHPTLDDSLPSIYKFNSAMIGKAFSPVEPSFHSDSMCSRIGDCRSFNFDFGALDADRSFMAWF